MTKLEALILEFLHDRLPRVDIAYLEQLAIELAEIIVERGAEHGNS